MEPAALAEAMEAVDRLGLDPTGLKPIGPQIVAKAWTDPGFKVRTRLTKLYDSICNATATKGAPPGRRDRRRRRARDGGLEQDGRDEADGGGEHGGGAQLGGVHPLQLLPHRHPRPLPGVVQVAHIQGGHLPPVHEITQFHMQSISI